MAAQQIANILKDEVVRIKNQSDANGQQSSRPQHLLIDEFNPSPITTPTTDFPTPIEEPRKTIVAKYLGNIFVSKPVGINVLNEAIDKVKQEIRDTQSCLTPDSGESSEETQQLMDEYVRNVISLVHISPSTISIESTVNGQRLLECRVRYLSFLGIHKTNVKNCGFIVQVNDNTFEAHCFECEPNSGILCKAIEAACKLRYQKCLDAHKQRTNSYLSGEVDKAIQATQQTAPSTTAVTMAAVKNVFSKLWYK